MGQLTELRTAQSNQRRLVTDPAVRGSFDARLELIAGQIRKLADHVVQLIDSAIRRGKSSTPPFMSPSDLIFLPG